MKIDSDIIGTDFQGWPVYRMNIREIIEKICKKENGKYIIDESDPKLDLYPVILEDDGMGYGVNDKWVTDFNINKVVNNIDDDFNVESDQYVCVAFVDKKVEKND